MKNLSVGIIFATFVFLCPLTHAELIEVDPQHLSAEVTSGGAIVYKMHGRTVLQIAKPASLSHQDSYHSAVLEFNAKVANALALKKRVSFDSGLADELRKVASKHPDRGYLRMDSASKDSLEMHRLLVNSIGKLVKSSDKAIVSTEEQDELLKLRNELVAVKEELLGCKSSLKSSRNEPHSKETQNSSH
jgi:hypothetical protein